jgi:hypothetical protein
VGHLFLLDGLGIVTLLAAEDFPIIHALNPGVVGAIRAAIEARLAAPGTNRRRPAGRAYGAVIGPVIVAAWGCWGI